MDVGTFLQQNKTKNLLAETNGLLREQNQLLKKIRDLLEAKNKR